MKPVIAILLLAPLLMGAKSGCWDSGPETTVVDTFCLSARKRAWSINDTPESIRDAEAWNKAIDRRCGVGKVPAV